jgi:hypothetical protein
MLCGLDITEDDARSLCELAAVDLRVAKGFAERALAEEDPDTANGLARTYQRAARSYRQSLALKMRLRRELARDQREDRTDDRQEDARQVSTTRARVYAAVKTLIWNEHEAAEAEPLEDQLAELLDEDAISAGFTETPILRHVARLAALLNLDAARELAETDAVPPALAPWAAASDPARQSSA